MAQHNPPDTASRRRGLRKRLTTAEATLWRQLQRRNLAGRKFRRQHGLGPYVLDFYCVAEHLAIELDGAAHDHDVGQEHDRIRDTFLQHAGVKVLRFENHEVIENLEGVLVEIAKQFAHPVT
jgi:very-short-patch-repair endonuclease